jgi:hypothetical protein
LLRSFEKLRSVDLGFRTDHTLTASYNLPEQQYSTQAAIDGFNGALRRRLEQLPGVTAVGVTSQLPAAGIQDGNGFVAEGYVSPKGAAPNLSWASQVIGNYFRAAGIPLLRGRDFTEADQAGAPLVVIVNQSLAQHYWPGQDPIGKRLRWGLAETPSPWMTVVGVIGDIKQESADAPTREQIYQPAAQNAISYGALAPPDMLNGQGGSIVLRTQLPPEQMMSALRSTVHAIDPRLPLTHMESMEHVVEAPIQHRAHLLLCRGGHAAGAVGHL